MKKIDQVVLTNFKQHEKYIGKFEGKHFILFGLNDIGKSSILDAIKRTIGQKAKLIEPVRTGADGATISTYIFKNKEQFCLEEKFSKTSAKSRLRFYRVNGSHRDELNPPLERFYEIFGKPIDFTPLLDMDGKDQFDFFKDNIGLDLSMYDHNYDAIYDDRTMVGRQIEMLSAKLNAPELRVFDADKKQYTEEKKTEEILKNKIDLFPLMEKLSAADARDSNIKMVLQKEEQLAIRIAELEKEILLLKDSKKDCEEWHTTHPPIDRTDINAAIEEAKKTNNEVDAELRLIDQHNQMCRHVKNYINTESELLSYREKYKEKTKALSDIETEMKIRLTELPLSTLVPGLELIYKNDIEIDEKTKREKKIKKVGLMLGGLPFNRNQLSYGKLIKAIIKLAAHFNADKLNFISIGEWNLLDPNSQQEVLDFAKENPDLNVQFGIEKVDSNKEIITQLIEL